MDKQIDIKNHYHKCHIYINEIQIFSHYVTQLLPYLLSIYQTVAENLKHFKSGTAEGKPMFPGINKKEQS